MSSTAPSSVDDNRRRTWSGNLDVRVPLNELLGFEGECYIGENLGPFLGGIGQGIDPLTLNTIRDAGGWFEVWYDCTPKLHSHVGYSVDEPNNHDSDQTASEREYNQFYFGNLIYDVTKNLLVGVEVSSWKTLYVGRTTRRFGPHRVRGEVRVLANERAAPWANSDSATRWPSVCESATGAVSWASSSFAHRQD